MNEADRGALADAIDADANDVDVDAVAGHFERRYHDGVGFWALPDHRRTVEKGTVVVEGEVVRGYPSTPRTLVVDPAIPEFFDGEAAVEEKLNGYNVRVGDLDAFDGPVAFTRSGYVCPYTTARTRELLDLEAFFVAHPDLAVCGELVGPENPYTVHDYPDVDANALFVFDLRERRTGEALPVEERRAVCEEHGFPQPELFGVAPPGELGGVVREVVADLDERGREGVVLQSADGARQLKYTTGAGNRGDLAHAFALPFDYGQEFLFSRVVREGFQAAELDDEDDLHRRAQELGEAILLPMVEAIRTVERGEPLGKDHTVRGDPDAVAALLEHFREQGLELEMREDCTETVAADDHHTGAANAAEDDIEAADADGKSREDEERVVEFRKHAAASTDKIRAYLDGATVDE